MNSSIRKSPVPTVTTLIGRAARGVLGNPVSAWSTFAFCTVGNLPSRCRARSSTALGGRQRRRLAAPWRWVQKPKDRTPPKAMRASKVRTRAVCALSLMVPHRQEKGDADHMGRAGVRDRAYAYGGECVSTERFKLKSVDRAASV